MESSNLEPEPAEAAPDAAEPSAPAALILLEPADDAGACSVDGWCD
ncbi:hypothetical protein [Paractinoplanes deccanensis]|nr:hypothetical protein [Actinoplanes deccanensis]